MKNTFVHSVPHDHLQDNGKTRKPGNLIGREYKRSLCLLIFSLLFFAVPVENLQAEQDCVQATQLVREGVRLGDASHKEEELYRQAIEICPNMAEAFYNLGIVQFRSKNKEGALESFEKALELKNSVEFRLASAGLQLELGKSEEALAEYEKVLQEDPRNLKALQGLSVVHERKREFGKALEILAKAREIDDRNVVTNYNLAVIYDKKGMLNEAAMAYEEVIQRDPRHFDAHLYLGLAYKKLKQFEDSARILGVAASLNSDRAEVYRALGSCACAAGRF